MAQAVITVMGSFEHPLSKRRYVFIPNHGPSGHLLEVGLTTGCPKRSSLLQSALLVF